MVELDATDAERDGTVVVTVVLFMTQSEKCDGRRDTDFRP